jgi:hypothetical protein
MSTFTDSPFLPAAEKRRVLTEWHRFLQTLARRLADRHRCFRAFPNALYNHLIQHCSFIAHYNRSGFFAHYFDHGDGALRFLRQFDAASNPLGTSTEYGDSWWLSGKYRDINEAMREVAAPLLPAIRAEASEDQRRQDLARARRLAARHGLSLSAR